MKNLVHIIFLTTITLPIAAHSQAATAQPIAPACPQSALDIYVLPPAASSPVPNRHILPVEIENIGAAPCTLDNPKLQLLPKLSDKDEIEPEEFHADGSSFYASGGQSQLPPRAWVHFLVAWESQRLSYLPCTDHFGLKLLLTNIYRGSVPFVPSTVEIRNLIMRSCSEPYVSNYSEGRFIADSVLLTRWLNWSKFIAGPKVSFPTLTTSEMIHESSEFQLGNSIKRILLGKSFILTIKLPPLADNGCDYRMMRKRDSDGATVITIQNCSDAVNPLEERQPNFRGTDLMWEELSWIDMMPKHSGNVSYDLIANTHSLPEISLASANIIYEAHDPTPPAQASVVDPTPECAGNQLQVIPLPPLIDESGRGLRAYEATNTSSTACSLAGLPKIRWYYPRNACPNCKNDLFAVRPNGRIDLQPGQSAHFLAARTEVNEIGAKIWPYCQKVPSFNLELPANSKPVVLPFDGCASGTLDVSTWREGKFDNDPMNIQWAKIHPASKDPTSSIPPDCNKPELLSKGRPVMLPMGKELTFGLSVEKHGFTAGEPTKLHLWVDNTSNQTVGVWTCMGLDYFKANGFDLYDAYGHRLLRRNEAKTLEQCKTDPTHIQIGVWSCSRNFQINIPAHTCVNDDDYDFTTDLTAAYDLPPGEYTLKPRESSSVGRDACKPDAEKPFKPLPGADLTFAVNQP